MNDDRTFLDGNAAAGELGELFRFDVTAAIAECTTCGRTGALAQAHLYNRAPGIVVRCEHCQNPLVRPVRTPARSWLDLRGITYLQITAS
jgi:Family of unknown function (DUF6510)